jgi:hypothetical protein
MLRLKSGLTRIICLSEHGFLWDMLHYCFIEYANIVEIITYEKIQNMLVIWIFNLYTCYFVLSYVLWQSW